MFFKIGLVVCLGFLLSLEVQAQSQSFGEWDLVCSDNATISPETCVLGERIVTKEDRSKWIQLEFTIDEHGSVHTKIFTSWRAAGQYIAVTLNGDPVHGVNTFIHGPLVNPADDPATGARDGNGVTDIKLVIRSYGFSGN